MRYAGFWPRLAAVLIDVIATAPIIALSMWALSAPKPVTLAFEIPIACAYAAYNIYFVGRWGQTLGKMALGIKVVGLDETAAGYRRAFLRHCVDLGFSLLTSALTIYALMSVSDAQYELLDFEGRLDLLASRTSSVNDVVEWLFLGWSASELVVLLTNKKRRALHDFIAGTVVVHTR